MVFYRVNDCRHRYYTILHSVCPLQSDTAYQTNHRGAQGITAGQLDTVVIEVRDNGEISQLAQSFLEMQEQLRTMTQKLRTALQIYQQASRNYLRVRMKLHLLWKK